MLSECDIKNELCNTSNRYYKFSTRDLEIKRACYYCRTNIDQKGCTLSKIYGKTFHNIELNKLFGEINDRKREIVYLKDCVNELRIQKEREQKEIANLDKEIKILDDKATKARANDFLIATIGIGNYLFYVNNGYFDVKGTNNSIYRITNDGVISKIKVKIDMADRIKDFVFNVVTAGHYPKRKTETLVGRIESINCPIEDAVAITYANILRDSDRFDKDKACGRISIRTA